MDHTHQLNACSLDAGPWPTKQVFYVDTQFPHHWAHEADVLFEVSTTGWSYSYPQLTNPCPCNTSIFMTLYHTQNIGSGYIITTSKKWLNSYNRCRNHGDLLSCVEAKPDPVNKLSQISEKLGFCWDLLGEWTNSAVKLAPVRHSELPVSNTPRSANRL